MRVIFSASEILINSLSIYPEWHLDTAVQYGIWELRAASSEGRYIYIHHMKGIEISQKSLNFP